LAFAACALVPILIAATKSSFWERQHSMAPVAAAIYIAIVVVLVTARYRWAWILLVLFEGFADLIWITHPHATVGYVLGLVLGVATLALLLSPPMRTRLRRPVAFRRGAL
jgi:hypothetical protein